MKMQIPISRAYYRAREETERLLCWIPPGVLPKMVARGIVPQNIADASVRGIEFEVSESALEKHGIKLAHSPEMIIRAFTYFWECDRIGGAGRVDADILDEIVTKATSENPDLSIEEALECLSINTDLLAMPKMSGDSDDAKAVMESF